MYHNQPYYSRKTLSGGTLYVQIVKRLTLLIVLFGITVRAVMIALTGPAALNLSPLQYLSVFGIGMINDIAFSLIATLPLLLYVVTIGDKKYKSTLGYVILPVLILACIYFGWFCQPLAEFNRGLTKTVRYVMIYWAATFALRLAFPPIRRGWTAVWLTLILFLYVSILTLNAFGELFFWNEFGVRYNFIAVDYLVYTSEVIGNILESYPIIPLSLGLILFSGLLTWAMFRKQIRAAGTSFYSEHWRWKTFIISVVLSLISAYILSLTQGWQQTSNTYYNELQANGAYSFFKAFTKNELDYDRFYPTIPRDEASALIVNALGQSDTASYSLADSAGRPINVVMITMESMSASFMNHFGSEENITPVIDSIYSRGMAFERMYACGNRTVRGLEALSLSLPPSAGQSRIKRDKYTATENIGHTLKERGYKPMFFYGGKSYFDNMGPFFRDLGYEVTDIDSFSPKEITFSNVWGVCDGDSYSKMIKTLDTAYESGTPFFAQLMTISNHRPFTYPEGCIDIPPGSKSRAGGVKYADFALGEFMREASTKPWFDNTLFVIIADHCASSAGETKLPPQNYHIPALIYAPKLIEPRSITFTTSQTDIIPTLLALIGAKHHAYPYGKNILDPDYTPRAYLATYQDLGYLESDTLTVLSPRKRVEQFKVVNRNGNESLEKIEKPSDSHLRKAVAIYQTSAEK